MFDVRFLPNPYFVPELKALTGQDPKVARYVLERSETQEFLDRIVDLAAVPVSPLPAGGEGVPHGRPRLHRRQAPQRRDGRRAGPASRCGTPGRAAPAPGHREGVSEQARAGGAPDLLLASRRPSEGRSNPGVSLDAGWLTPDLRLILRAHVKIWWSTRVEWLQPMAAWE